MCEALAFSVLRRLSVIPTDRHIVDALVVITPHTLNAYIPLERIQYAL